MRVYGEYLWQQGGVWLAIINDGEVYLFKQLDILNKIKKLGYRMGTSISVLYIAMRLRELTCILKYLTGWVAC